MIILPNSNTCLFARNGNLPAGSIFEMIKLSKIYRIMKVSITGEENYIFEISTLISLVMEFLVQIEGYLVV